MDQLQAAEQQLIGFTHAISGYGVVSLVQEMGLKKEEWLQIRDQDLLRQADKDVLDEYFNAESTLNQQ